MITTDEFYVLKHATRDRRYVAALENGIRSVTGSITEALRIYPPKLADAKEELEKHFPQTDHNYEFKKVKMTIELEE